MADNQTPQRDQDVVAYQSFSGLRNEVTPERFTVSDLASAMNVDLDKTGRLSRRDGYTSVRAGAAHSVWSDPQGLACLFVSGGQLQQLNADMSATPVAALYAADQPMSYVRVNDRVYFNNGTDTGVFENGATRSWGLPVPPLPGVSIGPGAMPAGSYQFVVTQMRADGQESGAQPLAGVVEVPDSSSLTFTLPHAVDWGVTTQAIYLSTPNGTTLFLAGLVLAGTRFWTYGNDTSELSAPLATQFLAPCPPGQLVTFYRGRAYVAVGDTLYPSRPFAPELFDLREYIQLDGRITMLAPMVEKELYDKGANSGFFVGTDRSCGLLVGSDPSEFQYVQRVPYGAIAGAVDYVDGALFGDNSAGARELPMWLSTQGICVGQPDLSIRNLTRSKFTLSASGSGAAVFMPGPNRFLASHNL
jgi:hypothetical protein